MGKLQRGFSFALLLVVGVLGLAGCETPVEYEDGWLDGPTMQDPSLTDPNYRVSTRHGLLIDDLARPVIIAAHGFTASTFEWKEFRQYAEANSNVLVSLVLLGGHGRTVEALDSSAWEEWGQPILDEYEALVAWGFDDISLAGASTGATLMLEQISRDAYDGPVRPRQFFFVDPIVVPGDKMMTLIGAAGPLLGNFPNDNVTEAEKPYYYTNRPAKAVAQLYDLLGEVRGALEAGFRLPEGTAAKVYKTARDQTADPVSALYLYRGLRTADGERIDVEMLDSRLHVFTRLAGRDASAYGPDDVARQRAAFREMIERAGGQLRPGAE